ncbi:MAG: hypothetical protein Q4D56_06845 [Bacteroides sp.]|nr:hypothetical protein [Bacteroides sp.]
MVANDIRMMVNDKIGKWHKRFSAEESLASHDGVPVNRIRWRTHYG